MSASRRVAEHAPQKEGDRPLWRRGASAELPVCVCVYWVYSRHRHGGAGCRLARGDSPSCIPSCNTIYVDMCRRRATGRGRCHMGRRRFIAGESRNRVINYYCGARVKTEVLVKRLAWRVAKAVRYGLPRPRLEMATYSCTKVVLRVLSTLLFTRAAQQRRPHNNTGFKFSEALKWARPAGSEAREAQYPPGFERPRMRATRV